MEFYFRYNLSDSEKNKLVKWYDAQTHVAIEQHPDWPGLMNPAGDICFFYALENNQIVCSAIIEEKVKIKVRTAEISFGPLFSNNDTAIVCIDEICLYYKKKGVALLTIQLGRNVSQETEYIEYKLYKARPFRTFFDRNNWSSITIDLSNAEDELLRSMSKGHKSDIKKAQKEGLTVIDEFNDQQFSAFADVYAKMHRERGLAEARQGSFIFLRNIFNFLKQSGIGSFLLVLDKNGKVIGGIVVVFQDKTARYLKGAADPEVKNLPVLHLAIWHAIRTCKSRGFKFFDLWGYNHFVADSDQVFFINRFKKGFGGGFTFYPKKMYFMFRPLEYKALMHVKNIYKKLAKHVRIRRHN